MPVSYYGDLSGQSSDDGESSSDDESSWSLPLLEAPGDETHSKGRTTNSQHAASNLTPPTTAISTTTNDDADADADADDVPSLDKLWSRCILHLDIDCFYCQCEEIDRNLRSEDTRRPIAIGQKHIIVTSNYEARSYGVKKLQLRESALAACPHLLIVEGSDLLCYKRYSRKVYEAFRLALQEIASEQACGGSSVMEIPAKKGCMDEMMADLSQVVNQMLNTGNIPPDDDANSSSSSIDKMDNYYQSSFVYGDSDAPITLVEDQTGQTITITSFSSSSSSTRSKNGKGRSLQPDRILPPFRRNIHDGYVDTASNMDQQLMCSQRLHLAGRLVARVCRRIVEETGFFTTGGISVSPLLAKLASDLNKPKSVNLLYPWRSSQLFYSMPLRKLNGLGRATMKALDQCLTPKDSNKDDVKTVLDLLQVPQESIAKALQSLHAYQESGSTEQCELLIQRCRGLDVSEIVDDHGGLPKTVSIENSFRRNTVTTQTAVQTRLDDLLHRLPLLLNDRTSWARDPEQAYPTTIRVTVRLVDQSLLHPKDGTTMTDAQRRKGRRPYVTTSRQSSMTNGKTLTLQEKDTAQQSRILRKWVEPLLEQLLSKATKTSTINLTRLNVALANFQDTIKVATPNKSLPSSSQAHFFGDIHEGSSSAGSKRASSVGWITSNKKAKVGERSKTKASWSTPPTSSSFPLSPIPTAKPTIPTQIRKLFISSSIPASKHSSNKMKATRIDNFFYRKPK